MKVDGEWSKPIFGTGGSKLVSIEKKYSRGASEASTSLFLSDEAYKMAYTDALSVACKILADSVKERLQDFITDYRTNKSRVDEQYYKKLLDEAKQNYESARRLYGSYADANTDVTLESFRAKQEDLENDMQLKFNTYSTLMTQYQAAKAKVQERTPAFTVVKGAAVPVKPTGPKRMLFVLGMVILAFFGTIAYLLKEDIKHFLLPDKK